jgi:hypothetical protein
MYAGALDRHHLIVTVATLHTTKRPSEHPTTPRRRRTSRRRRRRNTALGPGCSCVGELGRAGLARITATVLFVLNTLGW